MPENTSHMTLSKTLMPPTLGPATDTTTMVEPAAEAHVEVEATWRLYQRMIAAYREPDRTRIVNSGSG
jgi:hypothetical protein